MKTYLGKLTARLSVLPILFLPTVGLAAANPGEFLGEQAGGGNNTVGTAIGAGQKPLPVVIGNLINVLITVLGVIFVVLTVYAGYLYLTAAGDDKKVDKAKHLLAQAVIGLVIILAAYSIATFVITRLTGVTVN